MNRPGFDRCRARDHLRRIGQGQLKNTQPKNDEGGQEAGRQKCHPVAAVFDRLSPRAGELQFQHFKALRRVVIRSCGTLWPGWCGAIKINRDPAAVTR